jgi:hypothetical protein
LSVLFHILGIDYLSDSEMKSSDGKLPALRWWEKLNCLLVTLMEVSLFWLLDTVKGTDSIESNDNDYYPDGQ